MGWIGEWWRQPDHFRWLSGYLGHRRLRRFTGLTMAAIVVTFGAVPLVMLFSPAGPATMSGRAVVVAVSASCAVMALMWAARWPTREQSVLFVLVADACIAAACLVMTGSLPALLGCIAFAALAGYVALFHTSQLLAVVLATAATTSLIRAGSIAMAGDPALAVSATVLIGVGVLAVPFGAQVLVRLLGDDALKSHTDPLTGLRNRRGFYRSARHLVADALREPSPWLTVMLLDLDRFKTVNDTLGHAIGDRILVDVADTLRRASGPNAVVARVGGEEFVIAENAPVEHALARAERIRQAVAGLPESVTVSVGLTGIALVDGEGDTRGMIEQLVDAADAAMYEAKRNGGNQSRVSGAPVPPSC